MLLASERDTLSFVAVVAVVADVTFVMGINLKRDLPEYGEKGQYCHAEPIRCAQGKLREASRRD
jgi:hypothetical protein